MALPIISAVLSGIFAAVVTGQYWLRRRPHQIVWAVSLWLAMIGSLGYIVTFTSGGSPLAFRIYYLAGAVLMPALLGVGSLYLAFGEKVGNTALVIVGALGAVVGGSVMGAPIDETALLMMTGGPGRGIIKFIGPLASFRIVLSVFGTLAVAGVAIKSAVDLIRKEGPKGLVLGNSLIAAGVLVIGGGGGSARWQTETGPDLFWMAMALGWVFVFSGFVAIEATLLKMRRATRSPRVWGAGRADAGADAGADA